MFIDVMKGGLLLRMCIIWLYVYHLAVCACRVFFTPHYFRSLTELVALYSDILNCFN
jgi:hypothetical protein